MMYLFIIFSCFLLTLLIVAPIFAYFCDKDYMIYDKSCYYCDYANPKYRLNNGEVRCPYKIKDMSSIQISYCKYRQKSINFWEWLFC